MKVDHISYSGIGTYEQCPLKYYAIYELGLPKLPPHPLTDMGSAVHLMLEKAAQAERAGAECSDPMLWKREAMDKFCVGSDLSELIDELIANAIRWGYFRNIHRNVGCEVETEFSLSDGTKVCGKMDRIDLMAPSADVIDIKTQKKEFDDSTLQDNWQARIYNIGARQLHPEITGDVSVSFWVLRHRVQRVKKTSGDVATDLVQIEKKVGEIRACTNPVGNPTALCQWCPYEKQCPTLNGSARSRMAKR